MEITKEKAFHTRLSTNSSQCELEKRPTVAEHAHGFVVSTCNIARTAAHDRTLFSKFKIHYKVLAVEYRKAGQTR